MRGLKFCVAELIENVIVSHLAWGAWIEIDYISDEEWETFVAPRMGCVD